MDNEQISGSCVPGLPGPKRLTDDFFKAKIAGLAEVYLNYLYKTKTFDWKDAEQINDVQFVIDIIHPGSTIDVNCDSCLSNALAIILCHYERNYKEEPKQEQPKPKKKKKK